MSSPMKEPGYFIYDEWMREHWSSQNLKISNKQELLLSFMLKTYKGEKYFGESSTYYTIGERDKLLGIPELIKNQTSTDVRFLYIIRNPFARIVSLYYHLKKYENYTGTLNELLSRSDSALNTSLYFTRINNYLHTFKKESFHIVQFEDLIEQPQQVVSLIYSFLNLTNYEHNEFNKTKPKQRQLEAKK